MRTEPLDISQVEAFAREVTQRLKAVLGESLVGVYLHGSAVLGDFSDRRSDVDVVAVSNRSLSRKEKDAVTERLSQRSLPCPAAGLEFHVLRKGLIEPSEAPPFELHIATSTEGTPDRVVDGQGHGGDADLVMHFGVLHEYGRALLGPPPDEMFPAIPRPMLLRSLLGELDWAKENASPSYQVLNACRAWRFIEEGVLCSKTAGGEWAQQRVSDPSMIDAALRHRRGLTETHPDPEKTRAFLGDVRRRIEAASADATRPLPPVEVRPAPADLKTSLRALLSRYLREFAEMEGVEAESRNGVPVYPYFDAYWEDADRIPLGIWVAGELIGFCLLRDNGTAWEIAEFFITPDLRRRGVGTAAVDEIKNVCRQLGRHAELQAKVKQWNSPALAFWKNQGFQPRSQDETDITTSVSL